MTTKPSRSFDIFDVLSKLDAKDVKYFTSLPKSDQKKIPLFVVQRWMSGSSDLQILMLNEIVNQHMFSLQQHPNLIWSLLCSASLGKRTRYKWNKLPSYTAEAKKPMTEHIMEKVYGYTPAETSDVLNMLSYDTVFQLAETIGLQQDGLDELAKEWGIAVPKKRKRSSKSDATADIASTEHVNYLDAFE